MIYSDILTKTEQVRDRLVSAINSKGGSLVSNASLNQCAEAITALPEGGTGGGSEIPGQIFHASFAEDSEYAESGQPLKKINTPQFVVEDGIQCVNIYDAGFQIDYPLFYGKNPFTISFWGKDSSANNEDENFDVIFQGDAGGYGRMNVTFLAGKFSVSNMSDWTSAPTVTSDSFHHYVVTYDQKYHLFEDNLPVAESSYEFNLNLPRNPTLIGYNSEYTEKRNFYLANMKIFTRVLSADEISTLYDEFVNRDNPSGGGSSGGGATSADLIDLIERDIASIEIPEGTTEIGNYAFYGCELLTSVTIPSGVTSIGNGAFSRCTSLKSVTIPSGVTSIVNSAFHSCSSLTSVTIPDSVTIIGDYAFLSCTSLTSVTIPSGVTSIGNGAFNYCTSLKSVTIPSGVTSIKGGTFSGCESLTSVTIPDSVTNIGINAFVGCTSLKSVTIPSGVTSIGDGVFSGCTSLTDIYCGFAENAVPGAPWGAPDATTIHYNA